MPQKNKEIIHYDDEEDIISFVLERGEEDHFEEIKPGFVVEFNEDDKVIGFEIENASEVLKPELRSLSKKANVS